MPNRKIPKFSNAEHEPTPIYVRQSPSEDPHLWPKVLMSRHLNDFLILQTWFLLMFIYVRYWVGRKWVVVDIIETNGYISIRLSCNCTHVMVNHYNATPIRRLLFIIWVFSTCIPAVVFCNTRKSHLWNYVYSDKAKAIHSHCLWRIVGF